MTEILNLSNNQISTQTAVEILNNAPAFNSLSDDAKSFILKYAVADNYKSQLQYQAQIAKYDYKELKALFLGSFASSHTRDAYERALVRLELYTKSLGKSFAELSTLDADKFLQSDFMTKPVTKGSLDILGRNRSSGSIRRDGAGISAFYTLVARVSNNALVNPFRGTKCLPKKPIGKEIIVPTEFEIKAILSCKMLPKTLRGAIASMALMGLRVGALQCVVVDYENGRLTTTTKGKVFNGDFAKALNIDEKSLMDFYKCFDGVRKPFASLTDKRAKAQVNYWMSKLVEKGVINHAFNPHSFRHYFAVTHYKMHKDIYALQHLLNHSSIAITEHYLKGLNLPL